MDQIKVYNILRNALKMTEQDASEFISAMGELPNSNPQLVQNGDSLPSRELFTIDKDSLTIFGGTIGADGTVLHYVKIN